MFMLLVNSYTISLAVIAFLVLIIFPSFRNIGPTEVGLVMKRFSFRRLSEDNPVALEGEPGYQADLLMPGWRFKLWLVYSVEKHPWVQVPAGEIGVVIAQVGKPLPIGAKSAVYKNEFANFSNLRSFLELGGQKGVQRPVLPPGTLVPIHPVGFLVITRRIVYGLPISPELEEAGKKIGKLSAENFGLTPKQLEVVRVSPVTQDNKQVDILGIVTTFEGDPLHAGDIANRIGGYEDIADLERAKAEDSSLMETILSSKNGIHNNYQDFQKFLDSGGKIGLQHDPLLYGAYNLNPFLVTVELVPISL